MRKMTGFFVSGLLLIGLGAPAGAAAPGSAPAAYEANRHGYHGDRDDRDRRYRHDGHYHYRDGRYYHRDGRYHYRDGYYYGDDNHYRGHPSPECPSGEWAYHPNTGWMCAG